MDAAVRTAVLALCLVTAGCTGFVGSDPGRSETVTPAPVPESPPAVLAPGLSEAGVRDVDTLVRAHVSGLSNTSYTVEHRRTVDGADGTRQVDQTTRAEISAGYQSYTAVRTITGPAVTDQVIRTRSEDRRAIQWILGDGTNSSRIISDGRGIGAPPLPPREALFFEPTYHSRIRALLLGANVTAVVPVRVDDGEARGPRRYRVHANGAADRSQFPVDAADRVGDVSFTATVTSSGVVQSYDLQYTVVRNGSTLRVTESLRYTDLGVTTVETDAVGPNGTGE
ncbi:hypothetical protein ACFQGE_06555 [Halomicroarcula sp. GCM10025817]|uniref:hypothetical protein n=1 Tax=Haloarcula TaxID=2237 RepID=UPI0023E8C1B5|nr:hypothetical protein [Halomicroarcula sp. SYNS111]